MRLFHTLIAGGLLVLSEVPIGQPPPLIPHHVEVYAAGMQAPRYHLEDAQFVNGFSPEPSIHQVGELYLLSSPDSSPDLYLSIPGYLFPSQFKQIDFGARQPSQASGGRLQESAGLTPSAQKTVPTPLSTPLLTSLPTLPTQVEKYDSWQTTYSQRSNLPITGLAMFYNPNVMQEVVKNRLTMGQISSCAECIGNVALLRAGDLNRRVWVQWADGVVEGPFLVADVAAIQHVPQLVARHWAIDVDDFTAVRHKMIGPVMVTVWDVPPTESQSLIVPFSPLYPTVSIPVVSTADASTLATIGPIATPLSVLNTSSTEFGLVTHGGFPTETSVPTITPLPALNTLSTSDSLLSTVVAAIPMALSTTTVGLTPIPLPTATSIPTHFLATSTSISAQNPINPLVVATSIVIQVGFPPDTPIPTITPLPALNATPAAMVAPTQGVISLETSMPTATSTIIVIATSTVTAQPLPTPGFPKDTPVPTITPLPAISSWPSPTPTIAAN